MINKPPFSTTFSSRPAVVIVVFVKKKGVSYGLFGGEVAALGLRGEEGKVGWDVVVKEKG